MDDQRGVGWISFAGSILIFAGILRIFDAIWAFRYNGDLPSALKDATFGDSLTAYGWIYLLVGLLLILSGIGVFQGGQLSRWVGIIAGAIAGISAVPWLPYYPIWSFLYIVIALLVMYGLIGYGGLPSTSE
ncbi:MAG TPA: hypothetical protein VL856_02630 [Acidimicrobiia bacterium]|jgi:hypothetical protein|nr:hypothetical protein [Acidimicrobiia bacterium]